MYKRLTTGFIFLYILIALAELHGQSTDQFKSKLCNKKWSSYAMYSGYDPKPRLENDFKEYTIYFENGTGIRRKIANDEIVSEFQWTYDPSSRTISYKSKSASGKQSSSANKVVFLTDTSFEVQLLLKQASYPEDLRVLQRPLDKILHEKIVQDSSLGKKAFDVIKLIKIPAKHASSMKISAYIPYRYDVTNFFKQGDKIYFGTAGAGLICYTPKTNEFKILNSSNSGFLPFSIGSLKSDGHGGLWLTSNNLWHLTPTDTTMYSAFSSREEVQIRFDGAGIIGHDQQNNLVMGAGNLFVFLNDQNEIAWRTADIKAKSKRSSAKIPFKASDDAKQTVILYSGLLKSIDGHLTYEHLSERCSFGSSRTVFEENQDYLQWKNCKCEFSKTWNWTITPNTFVHPPFKVVSPLPHKTGLLNPGDSMKLDPSARFGVLNHYTFVRTNAVITITDQKGLFIYDNATGKHEARIKYRFLSAKDISAGRTQNDKTWPMANRTLLEEELSVFKSQIYYRNGVSETYLIDNKGTEMKFTDTSIEGSKDATQFTIQLPQELLISFERNDFLRVPLSRSPIDFHYPYLWMIRNNFLHQLTLDDKYQVIASKKYKVNDDMIDNIGSIKQVNDKLLIFSGIGLSVVNVRDLK